MKKVATRGLRAAGLMLIALAVAHCGDSDVRVRTGGGVQPAPGTFAGQLAGGGTIIIDVGSIRAIDIEDCDGDDFSDTYSPGLPIGSDGTFTANVDDEVVVSGQFVTNNEVQGNITGACNDTFTATRVGGPTPTRTPTPVDGATPTPTVTEGDGEPTPTMTPVVEGSPCPVAVEVLGNAGSSPALDSGWTGLAHNSTVVSDGKLTATVECAAAMRPCGTCNVSGPIANRNADQGDINNQRCAGATWMKCTSDDDCSGTTGPCAFFFGSPLPLTAGGVSTCVTNQVSGPLSGTANVESGAFESAIMLTSRVFTGDLAEPCPRCIGDATRNDGILGGTCNAGPRAGMPCDINGSSPVPAFGDTSLDCPPTSGAQVAALPIALNGGSGTQTRAISGANPNCRAFGFTSLRCLCDACANDATRPCSTDADCPGSTCGGGGQATAPNQCDDAVCSPKAGSPRRGECAAGPNDQNCRLETFRGCLGNADCPATGDQCDPKPRSCFLANGMPGDSVVAQGQPDPPVNGISNPVFATLFCIAPTSASAVNGAAGLPGLGRLELQLRTQEILP
jgi:hypothetical protein